MQQTDKYKLNLIETPDRFSPDPLNENARKLEAQLIQADRALATEAKARADADEAEVAARTAAVAAETKARSDAAAAEAKARSDADAAEAKARSDADAAEAKARADAVTAETNARKSADASEANTRAAAVTALDNRVTVLEARKFLWGTYVGNGSASRTINIGVTPNVVIVYGAVSGVACCCLSIDGASYGMLGIATNGFKVGPVSYNIALNNDKIKYYYLAIV